MFDAHRRHRFPGFFFTVPALPNGLKKTKTCLSILLGQETSCGATRLDAFEKRALFSRTDIRGSLLTEKSAPSPILRPERGPFLLALGSPFGLTLSAALAPIRGSLRESWGGLLTLPHRFGKRIPPESEPCQERGRKNFQRFKAACVRPLRCGPARRPLFLDIAPFRVVQLKPATGRCGGMVDTRDLKSLAGDRVPVRVRSPAPEKGKSEQDFPFSGAAPLARSDPLLRPARPHPSAPAIHANAFRSRLNAV